MVDLAKMIIEKRQAEKCQAKRRQAKGWQSSKWRVTSCDIRRNIESKRFTAILDAMGDRIDPDKIERARIANARYYKENEPILQRDILPVVLAEIFEKTSPTRSDVMSFAKYYESRLAAHRAKLATPGLEDRRKLRKAAGVFFVFF